MKHQKQRPCIKNSTILITGASSGMGKEIATQLSAEASQIILVARNEKNLESLASELKRINPDLKVIVKACDLSKGDQLSALITSIKQEIGNIDILINSAGSAQIGFLNESEYHDIENLVKVNVLAMSALCHAFLPGMLKNGKGGILNFSSFFGLKILPAYAVYAGSKHYVTGFSDTLRAETTGTGVIVSTVYPGPVKSPFWYVDNADIYSPPGFLFIPVKQSVKHTLKGFRRGQARIIPSLRIKLLIIFLNISPEPIVRMVNAGISRHMQSKQKNKLQSSSSSTIERDTILS